MDQKNPVNEGADGTTAQAEGLDSSRLTAETTLSDPAKAGGAPEHDHHHGHHEHHGHSHHEIAADLLRRRRLMQIFQQVIRMNILLASRKQGKGKVLGEALEEEGEEPLTSEQNKELTKKIDTLKNLFGDEESEGELTFAQISGIDSFLAGKAGSNGEITLDEQVRFIVGILTDNSKEALEARPQLLSKFEELAASSDPSPGVKAESAQEEVSRDPEDAPAAEVEVSVNAAYARLDEALRWARGPGLLDESRWGGFKLQNMFRDAGIERIGGHMTGPETPPLDELVSAFVVAGASVEICRSRRDAFRRAAAARIWEGVEERAKDDLASQFDRVSAPAEIRSAAMSFVRGNRILGPHTVLWKRGRDVEVMEESLRNAA